MNKYKNWNHSCIYTEMKTSIFILIISTFCLIVESSHKWDELPKSSGKTEFWKNFQAGLPSDSYRSAEACFQELTELSIGSENDFKVKENWK